MEKMDKIVSDIREDLVRTIDYTSNAIAVNAGVSLLESQEKSLLQKWASYDSHWRQYCTKYHDKDGHSAKESIHDQVHDDYHKLILKLSLHLQSLKALAPPSQNIPPGSVPSLSFKVKLPEIKLKEFYGDPLDWTRFWNQFESLVGNRLDLDDVTKYTYLTQCLKGQAQNVLAGFKGEPSDYGDAVKSLKLIYGDEEKNRRILIRRFINLGMPKYNKKDIFNFRIELENLHMQMSHDSEIDVPNSQWLIQELVILKLPKEAEDFLFHLHKTMYFKYDQIMSGLQKLIDYLDQEDKRNVPKAPNSKTPTASHTKSENSSQYSNSQAVGTYSSTAVYNCIFCSKAHKPFDCTQYTSIVARKGRLNQLGRCQRCARKHDVSDCQTVIDTCPNCRKGKHHSFLCISVATKPTKVGNVHSQPSQSPPKIENKPEKPVVDAKAKSPHLKGDPAASAQVMSVVEGCNNINYSVALATATVTVKSDSGNLLKVRSFFDNGSQRSFIHKDLANKLGLRNIANFEMRLDSFSEEGQSTNYEIVRPVVSLGNRKKRISMAVVDKMPGIVTPGLHATVQKLTKMGYNLADKQIDSDVVDNVQIMIGSDFFGRYLSGMTTVGNIDLYTSPGGYLIYGIVPHFSCKEPVSCAQALVCRVTTLKSEISPGVTEPYTACGGEVDEILPVHKLWDLDMIGINPIKESPENFSSRFHFETTVKYDNGRYWVELPFKENCPFLPTNYRLALGQMLNQVKKFRNQPKLLSCYDKIIKDQLKSNFIEEVENPVVTPNTHYLPHHAVAKQSSTTPLRIVYNCSAKVSKTTASLNDCLLTGPSLTEKLGDSLMKFRTQQFAYIADIEKAFLQVGLQLHHRDFTRFLWLENPFDESSPMKTYRFTSVLFGATCSPFLLQITLQYHLSKSNNQYAKLLSSSFYVDNLQGTSDNSTDLLGIYDAANAELGKAGMILSQWNTNSDDLKFHIRCTDSEVEFPIVNNVLGLEWDTSKDTLSLKPCKFQKLEFLTKRMLVSLVSTCFDPLGFCSPILIKGKMLIQLAWKEQVSWDTHLSPFFLREWQILAQEIDQLPSIKFPRCVCVSHEPYTLHTFVDASDKAYGAVSYLSNKFESHLVASKARVAPLKTRTLPQLELTSLQIGTQFASYLVNILKDFDIERVVIWSDSEVALQWVRNNNSKIPYVRNRVANIREIGSAFQFLHVASAENPADLVTRGISFKQFSNSPIWFSGPKWFPNPNEWPVQKSSILVCEIVSEITPELPSVDPIFDYTEYSSLFKLFRVTGYVFRFIRALRPQLVIPKPSVYWMQVVQKSHYPSVYNHLKEDSFPLNSDGKQFVKDLGLFYEESTGLLHSRGRLHHSDLDQSTKFPILIPTKSHFAKLLITYTHERCLHGGVKDTLILIRHQYWMPKCRQTIKTLLSHCVVCKRVAGRRFEYPGPPPLPIERVQFTRPFAHVGIDYSGPITITKTESGVPHKYYIVLFTCTSSRLVHLELAPDMSTASFINLFRRFCAFYSFPNLVISDNGTYFLASAKFFDEMVKHPKVDQYMKEHNIKWKFIAPHAPWQGGFYERMMGLMKSCLKKVLFRKRVGRDEFETVLREIQCRINNRPLTYLDEEGPIVPLTPSHLLTGRIINSLPSLVIEDSSDPDYHDHSHLNENFSYVSSIINHFKKIWRTEYLTSLRECHYGAKGASQIKRPKVGEVVIVERQGPQHEWPLGRIVTLYPDSENIVRSVDVLCEGSLSKRTLDKLVPLEVYSVSDDSHTEASEDHITVVNNDISEARPMRRAAHEAARLRRELIDSNLL